MDENHQENIIHYDDFSKPEPDPEKWKVLQFPAGENELWTFADRNAKTEIKDNTFQLEVNPFSTQHPSVGVFDNPKHLFYSTRQFHSPESGYINFQAEIAVKTFHNDDRDLRDAFGSFHIMDFKDGMIIDFVANNEKLGIIYERLRIPAVPEGESFTDVIELRVKREEEKFHLCRFSYNKSDNTGKIFIDGKGHFKIKDIPVKVADWCIGIGVCTLDKVGKPLHGQGARVRVRNIKIWNSENS